MEWIRSFHNSYTCVFLFQKTLAWQAIAGLFLIVIGVILVNTFTGKLFKLQNMKSSLLITGGLGYVGSFTAKNYLEKQKKIYCYR